MSENVTYDDAAALLGLTKTRIGQLVSEGKLAAGRKKYNKNTVTAESLESYKKNKVNPATSILAQLFAACQWKRSFCGRFPGGEAKYRWNSNNADEVREAIAILPSLQEEDGGFVRAIFLEFKSDGQVLIVTEYKKK